TAVEIDRHLLPALEEVVGGLTNVEIVAGDAMEMDLGSLLGGRQHRLIANLPYNIATPLLAGILSERPEIRDFVVTVQREVGERAGATAGLDPGARAETFGLEDFARLTEAVSGALRGASGALP